MTKQPRRERLPALILNRADHDRLTSLATAALDTIPDVAEELLSELDRARLVSPERAPANSVQMGTTVTYRSAGTTRTVRLVYPEDADIADGKVSIMTPIGAALIGLSENQSISWTARDGRRHQLEIIAVVPATTAALG